MCPSTAVFIQYQMTLRQLTHPGPSNARWRFCRVSCTHLLQHTRTDNENDPLAWTSTSVYASILRNAVCMSVRLRFRVIDSHSLVSANASSLNDAMSIRPSGLGAGVACAIIMELDFCYRQRRNVRAHRHRREATKSPCYRIGKSVQAFQP